MVDKIDKARIIFGASLISVADKKLKAGIGHGEGDSFIESIYLDYMSEKLPEPSIDWIGKTPTLVRKWIENKISPLFLCISDPPEWVGESSWRFIDETPMVFFGQLEFKKNAVSESGMEVGDVLYTFTGKTRTADGWELKIKHVLQSRNSPGTTYL